MNGFPTFLAAVIVLSANVATGAAAQEAGKTTSVSEAVALSVRGAVPLPLRLTTKQIAAMPHTEARVTSHRDGTENVYRGVAPGCGAFRDGGLRDCE